MRIISGNYRGMPLLSPTSTKVRPTADKVKQALFTKLQFEIYDSTVLDLFSGSGALGIEAISRGAKEVIFVDKDKESVLLTKKNLAKIKANANIFNMDSILALKQMTQRFDIILIDPPYASGLYNECLQIIYEKNLLNDNGVIVCEHDKILEIKCDLFDLFDLKIYGTVALSYFKRKS